MAQTITRDKINLKTPYPIWDFYNLQVTHEVNEHAKLTVKALLKWNTREELSELIYKINEKDEIQVTIQNDENSEILFTGIPVNVDIEINNHECILNLECYSSTYDMDMVESSRSFQNTSMQYSDMFNFITGHYQGGAAINASAEGKTINRPVIQYKETDWQFLKRMASEIGTVLTADITNKSPRLFLGIPKNQKSITIGAEKPLKSMQTETRLRKRRDRLNPLEYPKYNQPLEQESHYYYETTIPNEHIKIGDKVDVLGDSVLVTRATFTYEKSDGVLRNLYRLEKPPEIKIYGNERVKGISLEGKILDVKLDHVKIHLDIDPSQSVSEAFWYPCKEEANNVWHVMPHIGERVNLHIADIKETGLCMTETRGTDKQMGTPRSLKKPTEKYMLTKWNKQMALHEGDIEWDTVQVNITMDEESVFVDSNDKITIETETKINLGRTEFIYFENGEKRVRIEETKNITLEAEELLTFQVVNTESVIELDEYNRIHTPSKIKEYGGHSAPNPIVEKRGDE